MPKIKVRYTPMGLESVKGTLSVESSTVLTVNWDGGSNSAEFAGDSRYENNAALRAAFFSWLVAKKALRRAAMAEGSNERSPAGRSQAPDSRAEVGTIVESEPGAEEDVRRTGLVAWLLGAVRTVPEPIDELRARLRAESEGAEKAVVDIATILSFGDADDRNPAWCSACLMKTEHIALAVPRTWIPARRCESCGVITTRCSVPRCDRMAIRGLGPTGMRGVVLPICAEHTHEIPDFETADAQIDDLEHWGDLFEYRSRDVGKLAARGAIAAGLTVVAVPLAVVAAPAIGGMVGVAASGGTLFGAAATSHGLALLGGGALAAGGLGMAGGQLVIAAAGGAIGGAYGLRVGAVYLGEDSSFAIECVRDGIGPAVVYSSGFLTTDDDSWNAWRRLIDGLYPRNPVYRVRWGAKQKRDIAGVVGRGAGLGVGLRAANGVAARALAKAAGRLSPLALLNGAQDIIVNPWSVATHNASAAGTTLATILQRTRSEQGFILIGHSLGAALMATTLIALGKDESESPVREAHLLGAAFPSSADCEALGRGASGYVRNYFSTRDSVLSTLYRAVAFGTKASGSVGFTAANANVVNVDVSDRIDGHSAYVKVLDLETAE